MFVMDPGAGRRRRAQLRDRTASLARRSGQSVGGVVQDLRNRATGMAARLRSDDRYADDAVITARVRAALGRVCSHPGAIAVSVVDGVAELNGPVLAREHDGVLEALQRTDGVVAVVDHMSQHEDAGNIPALQGEGSLPRRSGASSAMRVSALCGAAALLAFAFARRSPRGLSSGRTTSYASDGISNSDRGGNA